MSTRWNTARHERECNDNYEIATVHGVRLEHGRAEPAYPARIPETILHKITHFHLSVSFPGDTTSIYRYPM